MPPTAIRQGGWIGLARMRRIIELDWHPEPQPARVSRRNNDAKCWIAKFRIGSPIRLRRYVAALIVFWTVAIAIVLTWELSTNVTRSSPRREATRSGIWQKEDAVYRWAAVLGGMYVPVTKTTQPDPQLAAVPDRDITTPSGAKLTLSVRRRSCVRLLRRAAIRRFDKAASPVCSRSTRRTSPTPGKRRHCRLSRPANPKTLRKRRSTASSISGSCVP